MYVTYIVLLTTLLVFQKSNVFAQPVTDDLNTCEEQLSRYRRFILQAILSFEDVCDIYDSHPLNPFEAFLNKEQSDSANTPLLRAFHAGNVAAEQQNEIWAFFKLLMAQFNDMEFTNIIKDAVIERCRIKSQQQHDEKRNSVVLGKKQRFHSWGGKRMHAGADERSLDVM
ncbi:leucokinin [Eurosta solidaginis]|uniref:leucokinin n=1 Tax=Eurosta solidaginis TaxID=178769 RepID=UPI0035307936